MGTAAQVIVEPYFPIQFSSGRRSKISRVPDAFYIDHVKSIGRWKTEKNCIHKVHTTATCLRHCPGSLEFTVPKMTEKIVPKGTKQYTKAQKVYRRYQKVHNTETKRYTKKCPKKVTKTCWDTLSGIIRDKAKPKVATKDFSTFHNWIILGSARLN